MYIEFEIHIFDHPPSWYIFVPNLKFIKLRRCTPQAKNFQPRFCNFVNRRSIGEKIWIRTFYRFGEKYAFSPLFYPLSIIFFPNLLYGHFFVKQKNIHPYIYVYTKARTVRFTVTFWTPKTELDTCFYRQYHSWWGDCRPSQLYSLFEFIYSFIHMTRIIY